MRKLGQRDVLAVAFKTGQCFQRGLPIVLFTPVSLIGAPFHSIKESIHGGDFFIEGSIFMLFNQALQILGVSASRFPILLFHVFEQLAGPLVNRGRYHPNCHTKTDVTSEQDKRERSN